MNAGEALADVLRTLDISDSWWLTVVGDSHLRVEHAIALQQNDLVLFIDLISHGDVVDGVVDGVVGKTAGETGSKKAAQEGELVLQQLHVADHHHMSSTEGRLSATDVLHTLAKLRSGRPLPACFQLSVPVAQATAIDTIEVIQTLIQKPSPADWASRANS
ncbi:MAG: hypothetical protein Cons2KO_12140 [Congregibacter sp.]